MKKQGGKYETLRPQLSFCSTQAFDRPDEPACLGFQAPPVLVWVPFQNTTDKKRESQHSCSAPKEQHIFPINDPDLGSTTSSCNKVLSSAFLPRPTSPFSFPCLFAPRPGEMPSTTVMWRSASKARSIRFTTRNCSNQISFFP